MTSSSISGKTLALYEAQFLATCSAFSLVSPFNWITLFLLRPGSQSTQCENPWQQSLITLYLIFLTSFSVVFSTAFTINNMIELCQSIKSITCRFAAVDNWQKQGNLSKSAPLNCS